MNLSLARALGALTLALSAASCTPLPPEDAGPPTDGALVVQYLEIVCDDAEATCQALAASYGITFGEPVAELGGARTAALAGGGRIGVRAPLQPGDMKIVRPYVLVEDMAATVKAVQEAGGKFALPPMKVPGEGTFAIYFQGETQFGLWQMP